MTERTKQHVKVGLETSQALGVEMMNTRLRHDWTRQQLADACAEQGWPVAVQTLRRIEAISPRRPRYTTVDEVVAIARALDVDPCEIIRRALARVAGA